MLFASTFFILPVQSEIVDLKIDQRQSKTKDKYIKSAHSIINHDLSIDEIRFAILNAALTSNNVKWLLEEDGQGYVILRWDYSMAVIYTKVEYNEKSVQLKYFDAFDDFRCENNVDGICYKNENGKYYTYMQQLRTAIIDEL